MTFNLKIAISGDFGWIPQLTKSVYRRYDISLFWENGATAPFSFIWTNTIHILFLGCRALVRHLKNYINYVAINGATFTIATTMATNTTKGATKQCQNHYSINSTPLWICALFCTLTSIATSTFTIWERPHHKIVVRKEQPQRLCSRFRRLYQKRIRGQASKGNYPRYVSILHWAKVSWRMLFEND